MRNFQRHGGIYRKKRSAMENKAHFTSFWNRNCRDTPLPELDFFDSAEGLQDRVELCKQDLKEALFTLKKEGLILRYLSRALHSNDYEELKEEICRILRRVFSDTLGFSSDDGSDLEVSSTNDLEDNPDTEELFLIRGNSFAFSVETDKQQSQKRTLSGVEDESESGPLLRGGSEPKAIGEQQVNLPSLAVLHSKTETSADGDVELLNNQYDKVFSGTKNLPCDTGRREILSNEYGAVENTSNQEVLTSARDLARMDQIESKSTGSNVNDDIQDVGDLPLNSVCGPFKSETLPSNSERQCKWKSEVRPHSTGSFQVPDLTIPFETKTREPGCNRLNQGGIKPSDIHESNKDSLEAKNAMNNRNIEGNCSIEGRENNEDGMSNSSEDRPTLAEEETFFVDLSQEKEAYDIPNILYQETVVVDDLISYLDGIEFENSSEEEDSAASEENSQIPYGFDSKKDAFRKKQLQSVLSTASGISGDSCLSPYALDVAMSEIHSAESSDQEEVATTGSSEPSPVGDNTPSLVLPKGGDVPAKPTPPVKPPRRHSKKGMVRAHTVGTPKEIQTQSRGYMEDEVFGKEEGYDGDHENQVLSQSHSNISAAKKAASVQYRSLLATGEEERRKLRRSRGSNVILDEDNVDFPSSPLSSPVSSAKHMDSTDMNKDDALKLQNRKWVASAVVDSEKAYLECLNMLCKYMKPIKASLATTVPILSSQDFNKIFFKVEELFKIHEKFYHDLELRVSNWNIRQIIGDLFLSLVYQFSVYQDYMQNYKTAMDTIHKCKSNEQFSQIFSKEIKLSCCEERVSLESLFSKPVDRIGRYVTSLSDLLKQTPKDHPDHSILLEVQGHTRDFLVKVSSIEQKDGAIQRVKRDHRLIKDGFLVELTDGIRKFRHLFLFNDVLLCTKRKVTARHEQYVCKWYLPLSDILFHPHDGSEAAQIVPVASESDLDLLKGKIVSLKSEIRKEQGTTGHGSSPDDSPSTKRKRAQSTNKTIEKLKKKLAQQEASLLLATPSLPFHLFNKHSQKTYTLLCKSDVERAEWKEKVLSQQQQALENPPGYRHLSFFDLQILVEACKKLRTCKTLGKVSIVEDKELLNGLLYVDIQNGKGFHRNDLYCVIEVDHYGQFVRKAKTKICKTTGDPVWNQDFDIEVEGSKEFRLHVFGKSRYGLMSDEECGLGKITLTRENLTDQKKRTITISLDKQGAVTLSIQYSKTLQGIKRKKSVSDAGVFGVDIAVVTSREEFDIPLIVIGCIREVEKRGTEEVGIYRLSGASSDVRRLKDAFNENSQSALVSISETDIHAVSGLLKLYLRELPEPLFTDQLYNNFVEAYGISDKEDKQERMLELLNSLPTPNRLTSLYLFQHLRRVGENSDVNKMSLNNLATIFGPNVLRPSTKSAGPMDLAQGTLDVMSQVGIFLYFLKLDSDDVRLPNDPELMSRLEPTKSVESVNHDDRLI